MMNVLASSSLMIGSTGILSTIILIISLTIAVFAIIDVSTKDDLGKIAKALWIVLIICFPLFGSLIWFVYNWAKKI